MTEFVKVAGVETPVEVAQILNKIIDEKGNVDLDNLSEVGEKRFSDLSSSITNVKNSVSSLTTTVNGKIGATVSKAANGYIKFTNGVIICWGTAKSATSTKFAISFSAVPQICCLICSGSDNCLGILCTALSKTNFTVTTGGHGGVHWNTSGLLIRYVAIGY